MRIKTGKLFDFIVEGTTDELRAYAGVSETSFGYRTASNALLSSIYQVLLFQMLLHAKPTVTNSWLPSITACYLERGAENAFNEFLEVSSVFPFAV